MTRATARALGVTPMPEQQPPTTVTRARRGAATEPRAPRALDSLASPARAAPVKLFSEVLATPTRRALGDRSNAQVRHATLCLHRAAWRWTMRLSIGARVRSVRVLACAGRARSPPCRCSHLPTRAAPAPGLHSGC